MSKFYGDPFWDDVTEVAQTIVTFAGKYPHREEDVTPLLEVVFELLGKHPMIELINELRVNENIEDYLP